MASKSCSLPKVPGTACGFVVSLGARHRLRGLGLLANPSFHTALKDTRPLGMQSSKNLNLGFEELRQADRAWIEHFQPQSPV